MGRLGLASAAIGACVGLAGATAFAQNAEQARVETRPHVSLWDTGTELGGYHNISAGCETMVHGFGRNAVWGRWALPTAAATLEVLSVDQEADLVVRCRDGSACIVERDDGERMIAVHRVRFDSKARAEAFANQLSIIADRCAASRPAR